MQNTDSFTRATVDRILEQGDIRSMQAVALGTLQGVISGIASRAKFMDRCEMLVEIDRLNFLNDEINRAFREKLDEIMAKRLDN